MKNIIRIVYFAVLGLSIALAPHLATAQSQGIGQGQSSGPQNVDPTQSADIMGQINALQNAIQAKQKEIQQLMDLMKQDQKQLKEARHQLKQLQDAPPPPPKGRSSQEKSAYDNQMADWNKKQAELIKAINQVLVDIDVLAKQVTQLQDQIRVLQQQLSDLHKKAGTPQESKRSQ